MIEQAHSGFVIRDTVRTTEPPEGLNRHVKELVAKQPVGDFYLFKPTGEMKPLREIEIEVLCIALKRCDGNMIKLARMLGIGRSTLYRKMAELGLNTSRDREQFGVLYLDQRAG